MALLMQLQVSNCSETTWPDQQRLQKTVAQLSGRWPQKGTVVKKRRHSAGERRRAIRPEVNLPLEFISTNAYKILDGH